MLGGGHLTKQALWERCTDRAAKFLQAILQNLLVTVAQQHGLGAPDALTFFGRVLLPDSPTLAVSKVLARFFPRSRNQRGGQGERRKIQACYDLLAQQFVHFSLNPFRRNDPAAAADVLPLLRAGDLVIRGIQVESFCNANNDGLDIDRCCNRRVTDSRIWSGDDVFVFKSAHNRPCENVVIANCIASSHCNAFKLGTESYGGFKNISIANCVVIPMGVEMKWHGSTEGNCGICLTSVDGGTIENVAISNISIRGTLSPVFIRLGNKGRTFRPENTKQEIGHIRKVSINNVTAVSAGRAGCEITGLPEHMIEDVSLNNIHITYQGGGRGPNWGMNKMPVKENPEAYPDILWTHAWVPSYGLFTRHVRGLTLNNFTVKTETKDPRSAMIFQDIEELRLDGVSAQAAPGSDATFWFDRVRGALVRGCVAMPNTSVFARLDGACADFAFLANDLRKAAKPFEFVGGAAAGMVQESGNLQSGTPSLRQPKNQSLDSP